MKCVHKDCGGQSASRSAHAVTMENVLLQLVCVTVTQDGMMPVVTQVCGVGLK